MTRRRGPSVRERHLEWLGLVEAAGPFLSLPVLSRAFPSGLDGMDAATRARLRAEHADWLEDPAGGRARWVRFVLGELLEWGELARYGPDLGGDADDGPPSELAVAVPEHDVTVTPSFGLAAPGEDPAKPAAYRLLGLLCDEPPTARVAGSTWAASPADRLAHLLRRHGVPLGLATDGRRWTLVWVSRQASTYATFDARAFDEEIELARAFVSLLRRSRFFAVPDEQTLPALLAASLDSQEEITEALGAQTRQAVELLVDAMGRADADARAHGRPGLAGIDTDEVYKGAVTVLMRLVFLLYAEERGLLPADDELYAASYAAGRLVEELEERAVHEGEDALEHTTAAWHRLLALFRAVHGGMRAGSLTLPAYDGSLFDPDAYPWLEGRADAAEPPTVPVLRVDDRTVLHMLQAVQYVTIAGERRRLSFRTLDVEQIGYVYEGLLGFRARRATQVVVGLVGRPGDEEEVTLTELEAHAARCGGTLAELAATLADAYRESGIGTRAALAKRLAPRAREEAREAERLLLAATGGDAALTERLAPFFGIIRRDLRGLPLVVLPGALYVTESPLRRTTGTHYTPRHLAEEVVEHALEPLVYAPGPLETADRDAWRRRSSAEILDLKVVDIACGSAAFLVAACRYLAARLIEAWAAEGNPLARRHLDRRADAAGWPGEGSADPDTDPTVVAARRLVIEHCLYGADINPMALEMAKLSLWLVSMDPGRPFTFLDDRLVAGDSLLGITSLAQLEWLHVDAQRGRRMHAGTLDYGEGVQRVARDVAALRVGIGRISDATVDDQAAKRELLARADAESAGLRRLADLVVGGALAHARRGPGAVDAASFEAARLAPDALAEGEQAAARAAEWLETDRPRDGFPRTPLHWPLVFPEVFLKRGGFDAVIGNPPFLGGQKLTGALGAAYREYLVETIGHGVRGSADLVAFFFLRAHELLGRRGQAGLLATNTIAQGDTREVGLDQLAARGVTIRRAVKSRPWPARSAVLHYAAVWTSRAGLGEAASRVLDDAPVRGVTPSLDPASRVTGTPYRLAANRGIAFQGSIILGLGFTMTPERAHALIAKDPRNKEVLFPYLNGQDLNSRPDCSASRWVINFHDWPLERAQRYPECFAQVLREVKPEREKNNRKVRRERWWQFAERAPQLYRAIGGLARVIVITRVSKTVMPVLVPTRQVIGEAIVVFASDDPALLALLSSAPQYWWVVNRSSTLETRIRYTPSDVFETFPLPPLTAALRDLGARLDAHRRAVMTARHAGLTATYNLVHDPVCPDPDIAELREIHAAIDRAALAAYGWSDLALDHGFYDTRQGRRYTVGPAARQEILDRLLELNHARHAAETQAPGAPPPTGPDPNAAPGAHVADHDARVADPAPPATVHDSQVGDRETPPADHARQTTGHDAPTRRDPLAAGHAPPTDDGPRLNSERHSTADPLPADRDGDAVNPGPPAAYDLRPPRPRSPYAPDRGARPQPPRLRPPRPRPPQDDGLF